MLRRRILWTGCRIVLLVAALVAVDRGVSCAAPPQKFPYEAVVRQDDVSVRSGPGRAFYPTSKLKVGDKVTVVRHNHGGWYMIQPPGGSFSWIPARTVERGEGSRGTVTVNNTPARVGSEESDLRDVVQRNLSKGESVEIVGEKVLTNPDGRKELWLRIAPPKYEWRYVLGQFVTTDVESVTGGGELVMQDVKPAITPPVPKPTVATNDLEGPRLGVPSLDEARRVLDELTVGDVELAKGPEVEAENESSPRTIPRAGSNPVSEGKLTPEVARAEARRLDARLQGILELPPEEWSFDDLRREYDKLLSEATDGDVDALIQQRLQLISRHEATGQKAARIAVIRRETERRDRELADKLKAIGTKPDRSEKSVGAATGDATSDREVRPAGFNSSTTGPKRDETPPRRLPVPSLDLDMEVAAALPPIPSEEGGGPTAQSPSTETQPPTQAGSPSGSPQAGGLAPVAPKFVGAGLVQRAPQKRHPFAPPYQLVAPNGRHLAWLIADQGVDLAPWVGKAVGLSGERSKFPQLQSDIIRVTGAAPVRLAQ